MAGLLATVTAIILISSGFLVATVNQMKDQMGSNYGGLWLKELPMEPTTLKIMTGTLIIQLH